MNLSDEIRWRSRRALRSFPRLKQGLLTLRDESRCLKDSLVYSLFPGMVSAQPTGLYISILGACNLKCRGCRYWNDFMKGERLGLDEVKEVLEEARNRNIWYIRFYGGEPLLHPELKQMVEYGAGLGHKCWISTNGIRLKQQIDALIDAGLAELQIGVYGTGEEYDWYTQTPGAFQRFEASMAYLAERKGPPVRTVLSWLLMRPTVQPEHFRRMAGFAERYNLELQIDLLHYSYQYFSQGEASSLRITADQREPLLRTVDEMHAFRERRPDLFLLDQAAINSVPDWVLKEEQMRVPCHMYDQCLWLGPDGTLKLCQAHFEVGNIRQDSLGTLISRARGNGWARKMRELDCPNCQCLFPSRTRRHLPTRLKYRFLQRNGAGSKNNGSESTPDER